MKRTRIIGRNNNTGTTTVITTSDDDNDKDEKLTFFEQFSTLMAQDWFRVIASIVITLAVYFFTVLILPSTIFWLKHLVALFLSLLFLGFLGSALKDSKEKSLATALAVGVIFWFFLCIACHYLKKENQPNDNNQNVPAQVVVDPVVSITTIGAYPLNLAEGQTSGWIQVDPTFSYTFSNPKATFYLTYEDGSIFRSWEKGAWPKKYKFKVTNVAKEQFDLITK